MSDKETINKLLEMRLTPMARAYRDQDDDVAACEMDFDERLSILVDTEWNTRRINKRTRLLRGANFSAPEANIVDICYDPDRKLNKSQIAELARCEWIEEALNLVITGSTGSGKTWLGCALGIAACNNFKSVRYTRLPEMLDDLMVQKDEDWTKLKKRYTKCDLLIVDDWLLEELDAAQARELLEIVETRNRHSSTMFCSQFSIAGWHDKLGGNAVADAIIDRIAHSSYRIHIEGEESMRKRLSRLNEA